MQLAGVPTGVISGCGRVRVPWRRRLNPWYLVPPNFVSFVSLTPLTANDRHVAGHPVTGHVRELIFANQFLPDAFRELGDQKPRPLPFPVTGARNRMARAPAPGCQPATAAAAVASDRRRDGRARPTAGDDAATRMTHKCR